MKTPGSSEAARNRIENFALLDAARPAQIRDLFARGLRLEQGVPARARLDRALPVLFSPSYKQLSPTQLADWILADRLPVRFQLQLHKVLWGDVPGK